MLFAATAGPNLRGATQQQPALRIAVNTTTMESFPVFAAAENNPAVVLVPSPNGRAAMAQLVSGAVDAATGSETQALLNSVMDPRIRIVTTLAECRYRIVARRSSGVRGLSDLRRKRVAVTMNTSSQYFLAGMLRSAGLKESDIEWINLEGQEMPAALKAGMVDAVAIWEPHAQNSLEAIGKDAVIFENADVYTERFNLNSRSDVLANAVKRAALEKFLRAISAASAQIRRKPPDLIRSLAPRSSFDEQTVLAVWPQFKFPGLLSVGPLQRSMQEVEAWLASNQKRPVRSPQQLRILVDDSVLR